ncbi:MAG TPA: bifunctional ADP-dependent NAD(P)H-hydrate dehydratase/NAD(P)H-hydrate epimerase [Bacteroidetes bacterium]|nr:bifunctional ADP-dependent NAD(P)H-hydrate dehydratase/NAD(P)H-hydrate epimerase [Bacteroidota bacterium]
MKILSAQQIRACDEFTIKSTGINSWDLMERAASRCAEWISKRLNRSYQFVIVCGSGNNGGDGLAISRMLLESGYSCTTWIVQSNGSRTPDNDINLKALEKLDSANIHYINEADFPLIDSEQTIIIDALFGSGLNRPLEGIYAILVSHLNAQSATRIAIDIPSGLQADSCPAPTDVVFNADHTLSFQLHKRSFLHPEGGIFAGEVHILDIGLDANFMQNAASVYATLDANFAKSIHRLRDPFAHKGTFGTVLMAAGQRGMMGAATLSVTAALRSGAGKVVAMIPNHGLDIVQSVIPEATCFVAGVNHLSDQSSNTDSKTIDIGEFEAIAIGPGIGTHPETAEFIGQILSQATDPLILDADALNLLAENPEWLNSMPKNSILTPHPGEFIRLFGPTTNSFDQLEMARKKAKELGLIIVLKGHYTTINTPDGYTFYNMTGNAGMATGGSGDVLTGVIAGLHSQGYTPTEAAQLGVYLHGYAGDLAVQTGSQESIIASDIIANLGAAFRSVTRY